MSADKRPTPKVSVGLPIRNGGEYLDAALRSILDQTERDIEIIISDNGSDDGSTEYLRKMAAVDSRIQYFFQDPSIRAYDNFRFVLSKATGTYFMWAAHDDTRDLDFVARLVAALESSPEAVLAFGDLVIVTPDDVVGRHLDFPFSTAGLGRLSRLRKISTMQCFHYYGLWRTDAIKRVPYAYCVWWPDLPMMLSAGVMGSFIHVSGTRFKYLELQKSNQYRAANQDFSSHFNLVSGVAGLLQATYRACSIVGGPSLGIYSVLLVFLKQLVQLPGFLWRRYVRNAG